MDEPHEPQSRISPRERDIPSSTRTAGVRDAGGPGREADGRRLDSIDRKLDGAMALGLDPGDCLEFSFLFSGIFDAPCRKDEMMRRLDALRRRRAAAPGPAPHVRAAEDKSFRS